MAAAGLSWTLLACLREVPLSALAYLYFNMKHRTRTSSDSYDAGMGIRSSCNAGHDRNNEVSPNVDGELAGNSKSRCTDRRCLPNFDNVKTAPMSVISNSATASDACKRTLLSEIIDESNNSTMDSTVPILRPSQTAASTKPPKAVKLLATRMAFGWLSGPRTAVSSTRS